MLPEQITRLEFPAVAVARADHFRDSKMIRKTQRPAAQRGETGSEDHSVVGILRRRDDLLFEAARGFIHHQVNQPEDKIVRTHLGRV